MTLLWHLARVLYSIAAISVALIATDSPLLAAAPPATDDPANDESPAPPEAVARAPPRHLRQAPPSLRARLARHPNQQRRGEPLSASKENY
ncbi:MAG TPA: hypothetical protein VM143_14760 [Acidimicrobiales bacterium]|nr:hypothetical protein [Acidimicrobiales bacterium]